MLLGAELDMELTVQTDVVGWREHLVEVIVQGVVCRECGAARAREPQRRADLDGALAHLAQCPPQPAGLPMPDVIRFVRSGVQVIEDPADDREQFL